MFERYTEKARRVIFFGRYEASVFGSPCIETEHLLLGLLREDKSLVDKFHLQPERMRKQIEKHTPPGEKISTAVDLPLTHESKRVLAFAAEEAERLNHRHIHTSHLLLGLLREENSLAANLLMEHGLRLPQVREEIARGHSELAKLNAPREDFRQQKWTARVQRYLIGWQKTDGVTCAAWPTVGTLTPEFAVYASAAADTDGRILEDADTENPPTAKQETAILRRKIQFLMNRMENAIANHEFEKARYYSNEENMAREELRRKGELLPLELPEQDERTPDVPALCIEFVRREALGELAERIDHYLSIGVQQVWLLAPLPKRAYIADATDGLRECKAQKLEWNGLELPLTELFL